MTRTPRPPAQSTDFDRTRLTVARRLRGLSKAALARQVGLSATAIAQFEKGATKPTQGVLAQICLTLQMPREFFGAGNPLTLLPAAEAHFRSLRSTSSAQREQALAFGELGLEIVDLIEAYVELPPVRLPDPLVLDEITPEVITDAVRAVKKAWGVGPGPVPNMVRLLEANGVIALPLPRDTDRKVDAFSTTAGRRPLVLLSPASQDRARSRFDAAHELGHLVLHPDTEPGSKIVERQAHAFAAEFLMPAADISWQLPRRIDWPTLHELKQHWQVSLRALVYRAHTLGRLSSASYRRANQQLSMWGLPEPGDLGPAERPELLGRAKSLMVENGIDFDGILTAGRITAEVADIVISTAVTDRPKLAIE